MVLDREQPRKNVTIPQIRIIPVIAPPAIIAIAMMVLQVSLCVYIWKNIYLYTYILIYLYTYFEEVIEEVKSQTSIVFTADFLYPELGIMWNLRQN